MSRLIWIVTLIGAALWSALGWAMHSIAGAGEAAIVTMTRWLGFDPSSTQWLAEAFSMAGGIAQWLVILVWLLGMAVILSLGWLGAQASSTIRAMESQTTMRVPLGRETVDGEVNDRHIG